MGRVWFASGPKLQPLTMKPMVLVRLGQLVVLSESAILRMAGEDQLHYCVLLVSQMKAAVYTAEQLVEGHPAEAGAGSRERGREARRRVGRQERER